ncbi:MAG: MATE family efflux transporter [Bacteroidales bacterium]|jgi:putative MATE family efflux protein|nr:MATE family efflux transporter [Bacteroidales bacterium]NLM91310.1 MATE family efflux transporter [Bacteroidales bacterium]
MRDLTRGNPGKQILIFALPMLLGNVFQQLYNIVDTIIIGRYIGTDAVAAAGASFPVIFVLISLVIGITTGTTIIISQYYGAKDYEKVKRAIDTAFIILFFGSIFLTVLGLLLIGPIWKLLALPEHLVPDATLYFSVYAIGLVFMFGYNGVSGVLRGLGDSKTPLYFLIIATILNIILDLLFVLVFGWGIAGVAVATVMAQGISFGLSVLYLNRYHQLIRVSYSGLVFDRDIFRKSLRIGIPTGLQHTFVSLGMIALLRIVNGFGTNTIAAYTIAGRIDSFAAMPAMNFSMALSTFVGQNLGANKPERVKSGYRSTLTMTTTISLVVTIVAWLFGRDLMRVFTPDAEVIQIGYEYLVIVSSFYILFSAMFTTNGIMRGAGDTLVPMFITLFSLWVLRIPGSYFLSLRMGTDGIWWGIPMAWFFGWLFSWIYYRTGKWRSKAVVKYADNDQRVE